MAAKSIGTLKAALILDNRGFMLGFAQAKGATKKATSSISGMLSGMAASVGTKLLAVGTAAVTAVASLHTLAESMGRVDRQAKLADRLGVSMELMQKLSVAAQMSGVDVEVLSKAMLTMGRNAAESDKFQKTAASTMSVNGKTYKMGGDSVTKVATAFSKLGISTKTATGQVRPLDKLLPAVLDKLSKIENRAERSALAVEIFGKSGDEMFALISGGGRGLSLASDTIDRFGLAISRIDAAKIERANDALAKMTIVGKGMLDKFAVLLAPTIEKSVEGALMSLERLGSGFERLSDKLGMLIGAGGGISKFFAFLDQQLFMLASIPDNIADLLGEPKARGPKKTAEPSSRMADVFAAASPTAIQNLKPGAFEFNSVEAVRAVQSAGGDGTSAIVAELKKVVREIKVLGDDVLKGVFDEDGVTFKEGRL